jgi:hypothetical protein
MSQRFDTNSAQHELTVVEASRSFQSLYGTATVRYSVQNGHAFDSAQRHIDSVHNKFLIIYKIF